MAADRRRIPRKPICWGSESAGRFEGWKEHICKSVLKENSWKSILKETHWEINTRHLCHWVPFPGKQAGSSPFVTPAPTGQGERKLLLGLPAKGGAGLPCHWNEAPRVTQSSPLTSGRRRTEVHGPWCIHCPWPAVNWAWRGRPSLGVGILGHLVAGRLVPCGLGGGLPPFVLRGPTGCEFMRAPWAPSFGRWAAPRAATTGCLCRAKNAFDFC